MPKISAKFQRGHPYGGAKERWGRLKRRFSTNIPGTADRLRRCQLSSPVSVINFWRSAAMLITSTVEICMQHLGRVEEMVFAARRSYASAVLGVVILFYTTWKGNPSSQMWFFVQLCSSWQDFNWLKGLRGLSASAELLVFLMWTREQRPNADIQQLSTLRSLPTITH